MADMELCPVGVATCMLFQTALSEAITLRRERGCTRETAETIYANIEEENKKTETGTRLFHLKKKHYCE